jgi:RsiW-degrading membrane proteinase PrsW (M82 family)
MQIRYDFTMLIYFALGVATLIPLVFLYGVQKLDKFGTGKMTFHVISLIFGVIAYLLAAQINPFLIEAGWASRSEVIRIYAPILEEILKSLILIYLIQRADFNFIVDGVIYGFGVGIGFAIIENYEYVLGHPEIALTVALARVFSTNLIHATSSGIISAGLSYRRSDVSWKGWAVILLGYLFSIGFHIAFNTMVSLGTFLIFAVLFGAVGAALIWYVIRRGLNLQKLWVAEKLGVADRATKQETKVVSNIDAIHEILSPVEKRFGAQKASLVRNLIYKQAEIGIKRKLMETTPSENKRNEIDQIIAGLVQETNDLRNQVGAYCMMFVRTVYLEQDIQIWNLLNARVAAAGLGQKGGGLWDRVNARMKDDSPDPQEEQHE